MALRLGIRVPHDLFSELSEEEEKLLKEYEKSMLDSYNVSDRQTGQAVEERRHLVKQSTQRHDRMVMLLGLFFVVTYGTFFGC